MQEYVCCYVFVKNIYHCDICEVKLNGMGLMLLAVSVKKSLNKLHQRTIYSVF